MTPLEREAVHRLTGAFGRLSLAAELVALTLPGRARAQLVDLMEAARKTAMRDFAAAMDELAPAYRDVKPPDIFEQLVTLPQPSSADPVPDPRPTPPRAAEAPATSTTPRLAPDAGGGRAVSARAPRAGSIRECALRLAASGGRFTSASLREACGATLSVTRAALAKLVARGELVYTPPPGGRKSLEAGRLGTYAVPGAAGPAPELPAPSKPRPSMEPRLARAGEPLADEAAELARYGVRRLPAEKAATSAPRAQVTGVHLRPADFYADKPVLPPARPIVPRFA